MGEAFYLGTNNHIVRPPTRLRLLVHTVSMRALAPGVYTCAVANDVYVWMCTFSTDLGRSRRLGDSISLLVPDWGGREQAPPRRGQGLVPGSYYRLQVPIVSR